MTVTNQINHLLWEEVTEGQMLPTYEKSPITKVQLVKYAGASGDFNPLHTDDAFAREIGMPGVIAHGMLVMGFLGEYVMQLAGNRAVVKQFSMRFGAMTFPGDTVTCGAQVKKVNDRQVSLELTAKKQDGTIVGIGAAIVAF